MNKKIFFLSLFFFLVLFSFDAIALTGRKLEIIYPEISGQDTPEYVTTELPEYISYLFNFAIGISGVLALIFIIIGGFKYSTSSGNPDKIRDAKSTITSALIGLLILFGSWLILYTINPDLIDLKINRLVPIISELSEGVIVCKQEVRVTTAFNLVNSFHQKDTYDEKVAIKKELDDILEEINKHCYILGGAGDVRASFNNNITDIYLVPGIQRIAGENYLSHYGIVLYEDPNFEGPSNPIYLHLTQGGVVLPEHLKIGEHFDVNPSSIKPFVLIPEHESTEPQGYLYQKYNRNEGVLNPDGSPLEGIYLFMPPIWWIAGGEMEDAINSQPIEQIECELNYCIIRSLEARGDFVLFLHTPDGRSDVFYNEVDNNLDDNPNLVTWVRCNWYSIFKSCAEPRIKSVILISAKMY